MVNIIRQGDTDQYDVVTLVADIESDIDTLADNYGVGSICFVIETSDVYMLGSDKDAGINGWQQI